MFTSLLKKYGVNDDDYWEFQNILVAHPDFGDVISETGGARKARMRRAGGGKSGGYRVIYYWEYQSKKIYMLLVYPKSKQENLTPEQKKALKAILKGL